jgi:hypothetical protein
MIQLKAGDKVAFRVGSDAWNTVEGTVCIVQYISEGCKDPDCGHDDCWREPFVAVERRTVYGVALKDAETVWQDGEQYGRRIE